MSYKEKVSGEEVEVVAYRSIDASRSGGWFLHTNSLKQRLIDEGAIQEPLMTVAQHQRITEALRGEVSRIESEWKDLYADQMELVQERDQLRAEVERLKAQLAEETQRRFDGNEISSKEHREEVQRLQAQLAQQQCVPNGYVLVPVEPTLEMANASVYNGTDYTGSFDFDDFKKDWTDILAASPAPVQLPVGYAHFKAPVQAEPASLWVAVSERLPKKGEDVQVYCDTSGEQMVAFSLGDGRFQFAVDLHGDAIACRPTHWMPLPKSPEASK